MYLLNKSLNSRFKIKKKPAIALTISSKMVRSTGSQDKTLELFMAPEYKNSTNSISKEKKMFLMFFKYIKLVFFIVNKYFSINERYFFNVVVIKFSNFKGVHAFHEDAFFI